LLDTNPTKYYVQTKHTVITKNPFDWQTSVHCSAQQYCYTPYLVYKCKSVGNMSNGLSGCCRFINSAKTMSTFWSQKQNNKNGKNGWRWKWRWRWRWRWIYLCGRQRRRFTFPFE